MSSIIEGYTYDIFISYRQKDNKGDRWVSEFVEALKTELESTFKEEISVYFDINPHDGLLETHDVDASLKEKLKCLIFIPIISRTYCDPKSFAWEHEFKAFVEQSLHDQFGLKVRLQNGNVASRVLPARIHDLDSEDIELCESVLGGVLRGIEFIYKEPGVNKPLTSGDDEKKNLNNTKYRIQINKTANAIKEIISGLKTESDVPITVHPSKKEALEQGRKEETEEEPRKPFISAKRRLLSGIIIIAVLLAAIFAYSRIFKRNTLANLREEGKISVAVMPFQNMTNDTTWNVWQDGIQDMLITSLSNSEELMVRQTESVNGIIKSKGFTNYSSITPAYASMISRKLDARVFIFGNIKKAGSIIRAYAQLIDSKTEAVLKAFQIETPSREEKIFKVIDSLSVMIENFLILSELKEEQPSYNRHQVISSSPEAFRYFIYGKNAYFIYDYPAACSWLLKAIYADSNYVDAILMISTAYSNQYEYDRMTKSYGDEAYYGKARKWCLKAYEKKDKMPVQQEIRTNEVYAYLFETPLEEIRYLKQLLNIDDQNPGAYFSLGNCYTNLHQYEKAIPEYEKSLEIYKKWGVKPEWIFDYTYLGTAYHQCKMYRQEEKLYKKAQQDFPDDPNLVANQVVFSLALGDTVAANRYMAKGITLMKGMSMSESSMAEILGSGYAFAGATEKAEKYFRQALILEPENPVRMNNLAYFLINNDRDINEGMELIEKALKFKPGYYFYLHTKGWGLYKQGKYKEALDMLQDSWNLRRQYALYNHDAFLHLEAAKKAVASQKIN
jgi:tetratricopeptide (TPR) repeat protein